MTVRAIAIASGRETPAALTVLISHQAHFMEEKGGPLPEWQSPGALSRATAKRQRVAWQMGGRKMCHLRWIARIGNGSARHVLTLDEYVQQRIFLDDCKAKWFEVFMLHAAPVRVCGGRARERESERQAGASEVTLVGFDEPELFCGEVTTASSRIPST